MKYLEIKITTKEEELEHLTLLLLERGVQGLIVNDPADLPALMADKEAHHWDYIDQEVVAGLQREPALTFYLDWGTDPGDYLAGIPPRQVQLAEVDDQDWLHRWKDYFEPIPLGGDFVVKPAWSHYRPREGERVIEMDPGMAFGTGTHETTRLCLRLLASYLQPGQRVLDVGTGTGILAMAAALLGSGPVLGVDIDEEAVKTARDNVAKNGLTERVTIAAGDLTAGLDFPADLLLSNLSAELIGRLAPAVMPLLGQEGIWLAGGLLTDKEAEVLEGLQAEGFRLVESLREGEWSALALKAGE